MNKTLIPADAARGIRADLRKQMGVTSRQVSVTSGPGNAVRVVVKAPGIELERVKRIAARYERVRTCEATGETLSGGNLFVFVRADDAGIRPIAAELLPLVESIAYGGMRKVAPGRNSLRSAACLSVLRPVGAPHYARFTVTDGERQQQCFDAAAAAEALAAGIFDRCPDPLDYARTVVAAGSYEAVLAAASERSGREMMRR